MTIFISRIWVQEMFPQNRFRIDSFLSQIFYHSFSIGSKFSKINIPVNSFATFLLISLYRVSQNKWDKKNWKVQEYDCKKWTAFFPKNIGTLHWGKRGRIDKYAQVTRSILDPLCIVIHFLDPRSLICYLYSTINIVTREQIAICPICPQCKDIIIGCLESWHFLIVSGKIRVKNRQQNQYSPKSQTNHDVIRDFWYDLQLYLIHEKKTREKTGENQY